MFVVNEDNSIYATRGDIVFFSVSAEDKETKVKYTFKAGDVLRIKVYGKKDAENVVLQKDFPVLENTSEVEIYLEEEDTKIGEVISKPKDYWYEVELNPDEEPQTIIGYDEDGAKIFKLFPEGADIESYEPDPEDFPVVDEELDMTSPRPVANSVIARAFRNLEAGYENCFEAVSERFVTPEMFGAVGDGVADDTESIQAAVNNGRCVFANGKMYFISAMIVVPDNSFVDLNGSTVVRGFGKNYYGTFKIGNGTKLCNGIINGNYTENQYGDMDYIHHADVWISGEHNEVFGVKFIDSMGESIKVENSYNSIHSCEFTTFADHCIYCKESVVGTAIRESVNIYDNTFEDSANTREAIKISNGFTNVCIFANHAKLSKGWFLNVDNSMDGYSNGYIDVFDNTVECLYFMSVTNVCGDNNVVNIHDNKVYCTGNVYKTPIDSTASERNGFCCKQLVFRDNYLETASEFMFMFDMIGTNDIIIENNHLRKSYNTGNPRMFYVYGSFNNIVFNGNTVERTLTGDNKFNYPLFDVGNANIGVGMEGNCFTITGNKFMTCCSPIIQDAATTSGECMIDCYIVFADNVFLTAGSAGFRVIAPSAVGSLSGITKQLTFKNNYSINNATIDTGSFPENYILS